MTTILILFAISTCLAVGFTIGYFIADRAYEEGQVDGYSEGFGDGLDAANRWDHGEEE